MIITKIVVEKFDRNVNFGMWQLKMEAILVQDGVDLALQGAEKIPDGMSEEDFTGMDKKARSSIILNLSDEVLREVATETTVKSMWDKLKALYMKRTVENCLYLKQSLYMLRMTEAYMHVNEGKLKPRAKKCIFLGYASGVKEYRLWCPDPKSPKFIISRDVIFDELSMLSSKEESTNCTNDSTQKQVELEIGSSDSFQSNSSTQRMPVDGPESTDKDDPEEERYSIAKDRPRRDIRPPQRYANLVAYALSVAEEIGGVGEPTTYSDAVSYDDSTKWLITMLTKPLSVYKFKQCLDLGLMENHARVVEYFSQRGVSVIFLFRRNLLRRLISQLANDHDRSTRQLHGTHKAHVHSESEANILARYKPRINTSELIPTLKHTDKFATDALAYFKSIPHIVLYYEDLVRNHTKLMDVLEFLRVPQRKLSEPLDSSPVSKLSYCTARRETAVTKAVLSSFSTPRSRETLPQRHPVDRSERWKFSLLTTFFSPMSLPMSRRHNRMLLLPQLHPSPLSAHSVTAARSPPNDRSKPSATPSTTIANLHLEVEHSLLCSLHRKITAVTLQPITASPRQRLPQPLLQPVATHSIVVAALPSSNRHCPPG
ncbi:Nodulation protein [Musa troglodytarum]|uniref:Nodulation protein n=1 Tax=Musa troglodytarum TaxID=320322 RepID=A0A9E7FV38_9LILI|nr:Nodulation protein [Musa troglodytarum]